MKEEMRDEDVVDVKQEYEEEEDQNVKEEVVSDEEQARTSRVGEFVER